MMTEHIYRFEDAVFTVSNIGQGRAGQHVGLVAVQTLDRAGYLAAPRSIRLFDARDWDRLMLDAAARNGLDRAAWRARGELVRIGLASDLASKVSGTIDQDIVGAERPLVPDFPTSAWTGLFRDYGDIVGPTTEAPAVYHFFTFALGFGACLGRRLFVTHAVPLFPNFFVALIGRTGVARKDTARARIRRLLTELNTQGDDSRFLMLPGIGSAEGLIECLAGDGKIVVAQEAELLSLMAKARRDATANIIPHLTALYDCPEHYTLKTRIKPVSCTRTFLSLLAGTTPTWLRRSLTEEHALGGFANRFAFVFGEPQPPLPFPPKVDRGDWEAITQAVNGVRVWAGEDERELGVTPATVDEFSAWYASYHSRAAGEGLLPALAVRFQSFAWKLSLLYAAQDHSDVIDLPHLRPALEVVDWLWHSNQAAFADFVQHGRGLEEDILEKLRSAENGMMRKRDLYKRLRVSASELERSAEPLVRLGLIQNVPLGSNPNGNPVEGYQII